MAGFWEGCTKLLKGTWNPLFVLNDYVRHFFKSRTISEDTYLLLSGFSKFQKGGGFPPQQKQPNARIVS